MAGIGVVKALILQTLEQLGLTSGGVAVASDLQAVTDEGNITTNPILAPRLDTAVAAALNIGDVNATSIAIGDSSILTTLGSTAGGAATRIAADVANGAIQAHGQLTVDLFTNAAIRGRLNASTVFYLNDVGVFGWSPSTVDAALPDVGFSRLAAGSAGLGDGTQGDVTGSLDLDELRVAQTASLNSGGVIFGAGQDDGIAGTTGNVATYIGGVEKLRTSTAITTAVALGVGSTGPGAPKAFLTSDTVGELRVGQTQDAINGHVVSSGSQSVGTAVVATSDGLTTGLIPVNTGVATVTVATDADDIITLPAPIVGMKIRVYMGGTGCEARTVAASGQTINGVDSDGTNELALLANASYVFECVTSTAWIARGFDSAGADLAALVPDAA